MNDNTPEDIKHILEGLKANSELGRNLEEAKIWEHWESIVRSPYDSKSYPLRVKNNILLIEVENAVYMHKISYLKEEILEKVQEFVPSELIEEVRFTLEEEDKPKPR
jgi:hypothetical protein